ncbi:MAG: hypothetical protein HXS41_13365 [Theionarchaea archaeon]|nr:hypothetical protein [Theionarchaea archaeon]MBU7000240.1 hypothetical protein [Theionarchaea archaeon]MBU7022041.1 hypothetical protein [Theionarchaea archaeon]MBU7034723.1 hypothetical protein [Theionarchaea archaeon]
MDEKMDERTKREMIRKYFEPSPGWVVWFIAIGFLCLIAGLEPSLRRILYDIGIPGSVAALIGLLMVLAGIVGAISSSSGKPTDRQVDEWLEEDKEMLEQFASDRLGTEEEQMIREPLRVFKPVFWNIEGIDSTEILTKKGVDGLTRFSVWEAAIFHLTDKYLGSYHAAYNFLNGKTANERTEEFFYQDIVKVGTAEESVILKDGTKFTDAENFVIKVSSGDSISVRDITFKLGQRGTQSVPTTPLEKTVQALRTVLREKKA